MTEQSEAETVPMPPPSSEFPKLQTVGFDARFPNCNQARNCFQNYIDFYKCEKVKGEGEPMCKVFKKAFTSLCPIHWVDKWDEQREIGVFPGLAERKVAHH